MQICECVSPRLLFCSMHGQSKETSFKLFALRSLRSKNRCATSPMKTGNRAHSITVSPHFQFQQNPRSKEISSAGSVLPASSGSAFESFLFLPGLDLKTKTRSRWQHTSSPKRRGIVLGSWGFWTGPNKIQKVFWFILWNPLEGKHRKQVKSKQ